MTLTSILGAAAGAGVHGISGWLLTLGTTVSVASCWFTGALGFFPFLNVSVDARGLGAAEHWSGEGKREGGGSWSGDECVTLEIWWWSGKRKQSDVGRTITVPWKWSNPTEVWPSAACDWPWSCPTDCAPPAAGRRSFCTPPSGPSSSWPGRSPPFLWHTASPHRIGPNAPPPGKARDTQRWC